MFWRALKRTKLDDLPFGAPAGGANGNGNPHAGRTGAGSTVTVEVLNQLIRENPANMTQAVRSWMSGSANKPNN
jgi:hypothetical protein